MSADREVLFRVQTDCYNRILASEALANVAVILERRAVTPQEVQKLVAAQNARNGKSGACILVQLPVLDVPEPNSATIRASILAAFTVLEHPTINSASTGTGLKAEEIATELLRLLHFSKPCYAEQVMVAGRPAIVPEFSFPGYVGYEVRLTTFVMLQQGAKVLPVFINPDEGTPPQTVTLSCGTSGADIWYTVDGSYPWAANPQATKYTTPISINSALTLRAAAQKTGMQQSDISEADYA